MMDMRNTFMKEYLGNCQVPTDMLKMKTQIDSIKSKTMIYLTNYDLRDYQLKMTITAIHYNSLIVIPTGLGKTFIGAVLILNYRRWFPSGKIIFLAPTRPLVTQQMHSISKILNLDRKDYDEITGSIDSRKRQNKWQTKHIFFGTPQAVQNDIEMKLFDISKIILIIFDEAHRARGNYSYCKIVDMIYKETSFFRIVGLTATPGLYYDDLQQLVNNLLIETIDYDSCQKYIHQKEIKKVILPVNQETKELIEIINKNYLTGYLTELQKSNLINHNDPKRVSKGSIAVLLKSKPKNNYNKEKNYKTSSFYITKAIRFLGFREKLEEYSIEIFEKALKEDGGKDLSRLLEAAQNMSHVDLKMEKLKEIVIQFLDKNKDSQIIIFSNYRLVVEEIVKNLSLDNTKCAAFVGQSNSGDSKGLNRQMQLKVIDLFTKKKISVLVATSIGEEGLDIGEVDMIVCYDMQRSITRVVQRMGRTGRKRDGKVVFLMNDITKEKFDVFENDFNESSIPFFLKNNMNNFKFHVCDKIIPNNDLEIIYKKIDYECNESTNSPIKVYDESFETNCFSPNLSNSEKKELIIRFGEKFSYSQIKYQKNGSVKQLSFESQILNSVSCYVSSPVALNDQKPKQIDSIFNLSSSSSSDDSSFFLDSSSITSLIDDQNFNVGDINQSADSYNNIRDKYGSPKGFTQLSRRKTQLTVGAPITNTDYSDWSLIDEYTSSGFSESDSFVSASSEEIVSDADYDIGSEDNSNRSPTLIKQKNKKIHHYNF